MHAHTKVLTHVLTHACMNSNTYKQAVQSRCRGLLDGLAARKAARSTPPPSPGPNPGVFAYIYIYIYICVCMDS
jgi:hypothetical protein